MATERSETGHITQPAHSRLRWRLGDVNGDGRLDAVSANIGDYTVSVLLGNGDGTFPNPRFPTPPVSTHFPLALGDLNGDGRLDIVTADANSSVDILFGNGDGTFQPVIAYKTGYQSVTEVAIGDLNGDGYLDLVTANNAEQLNSGPFCWVTVTEPSGSKSHTQQGRDRAASQSGTSTPTGFQTSPPRDYQDSSVERASGKRRWNLPARDGLCSRT